MTKNDLKKLKKDELIELIDETRAFTERMSKAWEKETHTTSDEYLKAYYEACQETYETILEKMATFYAETVESKKGGF